MLKKGAIHLSMSTITVALSERLTEAHRVVGQHFVAAPVFGRPEAAAAAKLYILSPPVQRNRWIAANRYSTRLGKRHSSSGSCPRLPI
jgi:hypothetical protein